MDTIICDITAFDYWRIPPIVQLLLAGNETDPVLTKLFKEETVLATREAMASSPLCQTWLRPNPATRNIGRAAKDLMPAISLLAASHRGPIDISVDDRTRCYTPGITRPRFSANDMPFGSTTPHRREPSSGKPTIYAPAACGEGKPYPRHHAGNRSLRIFYDLPSAAANQRCTPNMRPKPPLSRSRRMGAVHRWQWLFDGSLDAPRPHHRAGTIPHDT